MFGSYNQTSRWSWVFGLSWSRSIAIKDRSVICGYGDGRGWMWGIRKSHHWWWRGEVFPDQRSVASLGEGRADRVSHEKCWCVCMECLRSSEVGSKFHLPSFECQSIRHPQKSNHIGARLRTILMLSRRMWLNLNGLGLLKRCFTLSGWPILQWWRRRVKSGEYVWISKIWTRPTQKIPSLCLE